MTGLLVLMAASLVLVVVAVVVYTLVGHWMIPRRERVPLHRLGWAGWLHTMRRSVVLAGEVMPGGGIRSL